MGQSSQIGRFLLGVKLLVVKSGVCEHFCCCHCTGREILSLVKTCLLILLPMTLHRDGSQVRMCLHLLPFVIISE